MITSNFNIYLTFDLKNYRITANNFYYILRLGRRGGYFMEIILVFFGALLGTTFSIITTIIFENFRKPKLKLEIVNPDDRKYIDHPAKQARFLCLKLSNKLLPLFVRWMSRNAAMQCHGFITFYHLDGQDVFGRAMPIRWCNSPEPSIMKIDVKGKQCFITDSVNFTLEPRLDIYPGESENLNIVVRFDNEDECYGWNNESYFSKPLWRNPSWKMSKGRYLIMVTILSAGETIRGKFRLINDISQHDFRIETALPIDSLS
jgi:hypothetical protein